MPTFIIGLLLGEAVIIAIGVAGFDRLRSQYPNEMRWTTFQAVAVPVIMVVYAVALIVFSRS